MTEAVVALMTGPDRDTMLSLGRALVEERVIACLNIVERVTSVYRWEGRVREDDEVLAILKTTRGRVEALERRVAELHPYDVPELLIIPVAAGSGAYLDWVVGEVSD